MTQVQSAATIAESTTTQDVDVLVLNSIDPNETEESDTLDDELLNKIVVDEPHEDVPCCGFVSDEDTIDTDVEFPVDAITE